MYNHLEEAWKRKEDALLEGAGGCQALPKE